MMFMGAKDSRASLRYARRLYYWVMIMKRIEPGVIGAQNILVNNSADRVCQSYLLKSAYSWNSITRSKSFRMDYNDTIFDYNIVQRCPVQSTRSSRYFIPVTS